MQLVYLKKLVSGRLIVILAQHKRFVNNLFNNGLV